MVSSFFWWQQIAHQAPGGILDSAIIRRMKFQDFIKSRYGLYFINEWHGTMSDWYTWKGQKIVNHVGKSENLEFELNYILNRLQPGITENKIEVPKLNASTRKTYRNYYDNESIEIVYERFKDVIQEFDYRF